MGNPKRHRARKPSRKNKDTRIKGQPAEKRCKANETTSNDKSNDETVITHMPRPSVASTSEVQSEEQEVDQTTPSPPRESSSARKFGGNPGTPIVGISHHATRPACFLLLLNFILLMYSNVTISFYLLSLFDQF